MTSPTSNLQLLGIDAAVAPEKTGIAAALAERGTWQVHAVAIGERNRPVADQIMRLIDPDVPLLVAVDAPLGWPEPLVKALSRHRAGEPVAADPATAFARETDRFVREQTGLKPLDVGADRIARTAAAALSLIENLRQKSGQPLSLLRGPESAAAGGLIEVYPAASLKQRGLPFRQYKKPEATKLRQQIVEAIALEMDLGEAIKGCTASDHCLDAALCLLTAIDFLEGRCHAPASPDWGKEGWIWFPCARKN